MTRAREASRPSAEELGMWKQLLEFTEDWRALGAEFGERLIKPASRSTAAVYLLGAVIALGGAGVWASVALTRFGYAKPHEVGLHAATYAVAIIFTSIGDL